VPTKHNVKGGPKVWRLDRWGRSVADLVSTLQELTALGVGFVSVTEALDLTTPAGRAMAGLLSVFAEFERDIMRERVRAGLAHARSQGKRLGRPPTAAGNADSVRDLFLAGISKSEIARRLKIGRTSVRQLLEEKNFLAEPAYAGLPKGHDHHPAPGCTRCRLSGPSGTFRERFVSKPPVHPEAPIAVWINKPAAKPDNNTQ
jgi:hypothetical protein